MAEVDGAYPQKNENGARGVSLTQPERTFLDALLSPIGYTDEELNALSAKANLTKDEGLYIEEWIVHHGVHWLTCENPKLNNVLNAQSLRNPKIRRIIDAAADQGLCVHTSACKEELEDYFTQRIRNPFLPDTVRDNAALQLAKLKGYFPDEKGKGGTAAVQIILANPYGDTKAVVNEVG